MMPRCAARAITLLAAAASVALPTLARSADRPTDPRFFRLLAAVKLPGAEPDWDYLAFDGTRKCLFIARRDAGLWAYDTRQQRLLRKIDQTDGSGATLLLPQRNRGFSINEDGTLTEFDLAILLNERDRDAVLKIDARSMKITAEWKITGCSQPAGIGFDGAAHRAFVECPGDHPVLAVVDSDGGRTITTLPLGRGNDGIVFDAAHHRILTTNGVESDMVVYDQMDADHYRLDQAVTTRPQAPTLAYDPNEERLFTVSAEGVVDPSKPVNTGPAQFYPNHHYDGSFVVLTCGPATPPRRTR